MLIDIDKVIVPERARKKFSNIDKLSASIKENGLIHPPTITPDFQLIAGERRLRACKLLGYQQIEVRVMTVTDDVHHLKLERDENDNREAFTFSEAVELGRRIEDFEKEKARDRSHSNLKQNADGENFHARSEGRTSDIVAEQIGFGSGKQYEKAKFVSDNAAPELIKQLDEKQISVHAAYQKLKKEADEAKSKAVELEAEIERTQKKFRDAIPKDMIPDIEAAAIERHQEETDVLLSQKEQEKQMLLKQKEDEWKRKLKEDRDNDNFTINTLRQGLKRTKEELAALKLQNPEGFDEQQATIQRKKLQHEADISTIQVRVHIKNFLEKAAIGSYMVGAIAASDEAERKRLSECVDMLDRYVDQIKLALSGRKIGEINE